MATRPNIGTLRKIVPCPCIAEKYPREHSEISKALRTIRIHNVARCPHDQRKSVETYVVGELERQARVGEIKDVPTLLERGKALVESRIAALQTA